MAKKRSMLTASDTATIDIDAMLSADTSELVIDSPVTPNRKIKLKLQIIPNNEILTKTTVIEENLRDQEFLNEVSLGTLISKLKLTNGNVVPAIGRINGDIIETVFGSRRRMGCHFGGLNFTILTSEDITNAEAKILADVENESSDISLIERGFAWLKHFDNGMSYRQIETEIEKGAFSHTLIKSACDGAKIPKEILHLYPSIEMIGRPTITKLTYALGFKPNVEELVNHIKANFGDVIKDLEEKYILQGDVKTGSLTNAICEYSRPTVKESYNWPKQVTIMKSRKGRVKSISLEEDLTKEQETKLMAFLAKLYN